MNRSSNINPTKRLEVEVEKEFTDSHRKALLKVLVENSEIYNELGSNVDKLLNNSYWCSENGFQCGGKSLDKYKLMYAILKKWGYIKR